MVSNRNARTFVYVGEVETWQCAGSEEKEKDPGREAAVEEEDFKSSRMAA